MKKDKIVMRLIPGVILTGHSAVTAGPVDQATFLHNRVYQHLALKKQISPSKQYPGYWE